MAHIIKDYTLEEADDNVEADFEIRNPATLVGSHISHIPLASAVQSPRLFYGARFFNQALSLDKGEAPLVQNAIPDDPEGRSYDELRGKDLGAVRSSVKGTVKSIDDDTITVKGEDGQSHTHDLYKDFTFNQKSGITNRPVVEVGQDVTTDTLLAASNYTDDQGTMNMGINARIALVPFKGQTMDDAVVISQGLADKLTARQYKVLKQDANADLAMGLNHYRSLFPTTYTKEKLETLDDNGVVNIGTVVKPGDPLILGTLPRAVNSAGANVGRLTKALSQSRRDATVTWDGAAEATVTDVRKTKNGQKVVLSYKKASSRGDKVVLRQGAKGTIADVIPDDRMPRTADGVPAEMLLNPLSLLSRANPATAYEMVLGKIAAKTGKPIKVPSFLPKGETWQGYTQKLLDEHDLTDTEVLFDPVSGQNLENPVLFGNAYINKLHHTAFSKTSARGVGAYTADEQPAKGPGEQAQAKRLSGLESASLMSSGAYSVLKDSATLRGQKNDAYWRALRSGKQTPKTGESFIWKKFRTLLQGSGIHTRDLGQGKLRLAPFTDKELDSYNPVDVEQGDLIDLKNMQPVKDGLFDPRIVAGSKWGRIRLPRPVINPAYEESVRHILGIKKADMQAVLEGKMTLEEARMGV